MKTITKIAIALLVLGPLPRPAFAATLQDAVDSFKQEGNATILNNGFAAYVHDLNNGSDAVMIGSSFYQWGAVTGDAGMILPTEYNRTGTPLVGVSLHIDRLMRMYLPGFITALQGSFPKSSQKFLPLMYVGAAPVYNFNAPTNQAALDLDVWSGLEFNW